MIFLGLVVSRKILFVVMKNVDYLSQKKASQNEREEVNSTMKSTTTSRKSSISSEK